MPAVGVDPHGVGDLLQPPVQIEGNPGPSRAHFPALNAAADRIAAQSVRPLDEHDVQSQPRRRQGRAQSAAAAANHGQIVLGSVGRRWSSGNRRVDVRPAVVSGKRPRCRCQEDQERNTVAHASLQKPGFSEKPGFFHFHYQGPDGTSARVTQASGSTPIRRSRSASRSARSWASSARAVSLVVRPCPLVVGPLTSGLDELPGAVDPAQPRAVHVLVSAPPDLQPQAQVRKPDRFGQRAVLASIQLVDWSVPAFSHWSGS